jgi:Ca-activated chloride channel family protein
LTPPEDDAGGTGGQLEADAIVFDNRAKTASQTQEVDVGAGDQLSDDELRALWLRRVQTQPADFLRAKFNYQLSQSEKGKNTP